MLLPRIMPCLLLDGASLVKTTKFKNPRYVGDPVNVINIFNHLEVDEIILLDIRASRLGQPPSFHIVEQIANECTAPLAYGGGITSVDQIGKILEIGAEKVVINTRAGEDPSFVAKAADTFGSQAIIVAMDVCKTLFGKYRTCLRGGSQRLDWEIAEYATIMQRRGAGEILLTSIDRDGTRKGYDLELIRRVSSAVDIPVIACGGAGQRDDLAAPVKKAGAAASAAGSLFLFQQLDHGVVINFPTRTEINAILEA